MGALTPQLAIAFALAPLLFTALIVERRISISNRFLQDGGKAGVQDGELVLVVLGRNLIKEA